MKKLSLFALILVLSACAGTVKTTIVSTSPRSVVIQSFVGVGDAQKFATVECGKHGREARYASTLPGTIQYAFDCI